MIDRAALRDALADLRGRDFLVPYDLAEQGLHSWQEVIAAARFAEKLLPEDCQNCRVCVHGRYEMHTSSEWACGGPFTILQPRSICPACDGTGKVLDEGTVKRIARAVEDAQPELGRHASRRIARAVLSALVEDRL